MGWRDNAWFQWFPVALIGSMVVALTGAVVWSHFQPPCKKFERRTVIATETKYTRGGPRFYDVCIERE